MGALPCSCWCRRQGGRPSSRGGSWAGRRAGRRVAAVYRAVRPRPLATVRYVRPPPRPCPRPPTQDDSSATAPPAILCRAPATTTTSLEEDDDDAECRRRERREAKQPPRREDDGRGRCRRTVPRPRRGHPTLPRRRAVWLGRFCRRRPRERQNRRVGDGSPRLMYPQLTSDPQDTLGHAGGNAVGKLLRSVVALAFAASTAPAPANTRCRALSERAGVRIHVSLGRRSAPLGSFEQRPGRLVGTRSDLSSGRVDRASASPTRALHAHLRNACRRVWHRRVIRGARRSSTYDSGATAMDGPTPSTNVAVLRPCPCMCGHAVAARVPLDSAECALPAPLRCFLTSFACRHTANRTNACPPKLGVKLGEIVVPPGCSSAKIPQISYGRRSGRRRSGRRRSGRRRSGRRRSGGPTPLPPVIRISPPLCSSQLSLSGDGRRQAGEKRQSVPVPAKHDLLGCSAPAAAGRARGGPSQRHGD